jgi:L-threonylcarbamoyladenylate synthase
MKKHPQVADIVTAGSETVAVRMPANPLALALIKASGKPIAAPSANRFGYTSPTTAEHVREQLSSRIAAILDGGACTVGIESTVLALHTPIPTILRPGKIGCEELKPLLGEVAMAKQAGPTDTKMESPGLLESHYAPTTPLYLVDDVRQYQGCEDVGVLLSEDIGVSFKGPVAYISEDKDSEKAAMRLYWAIRKLDGMGLRFMVCSLLPEQGIGVAINNRLRKAATKKAQPSC